MLVHDLLAEHHGEELVVGDVLHQGSVDVPGLLQDKTVRSSTELIVYYVTDLGSNLVWVCYK